MARMKDNVKTPFINKIETIYFVPMDTSFIWADSRPKVVSPTQKLSAKPTTFNNTDSHYHFYIL